MSSQTPCNGSQHQGTNTNTLLNDRLIKALNQEKTDRAPIWLMRQAGRYLPEYRQVRAHHVDFLAMCRCPETTTELALQPLRRFKLDAAIVFSDILTIPDALDMGLYFEPGVGPIISNPIKNPKDIEHLPFHEALYKLDYVYSAVSDLKGALGNRMPLIGFSGSPWSLACYMINGQNINNFQFAKQFAYEHPVATTELLVKLSKLISAYLIQQAKHGADILFLIDTWGGILPFSHYERYALDPLDLIQTELQKNNVQQPLLFYSKGFSTLHNEKFISKSNIRGLAIDWTASLKNAYRDLSSHLTIQGNLDPSVLHAGPLATQQHTKQMLESVQPKRNYIASLGHGILPGTPLESIHTFIDTVHNHKST